MDPNDVKTWARRSLIKLTRKAGEGPLRAARHSYVLHHIADQVFWSARAHGYPVDGVRAFDPFAGTGLLMSHTYVHRCEHVDLWEIEPERAKQAALLAPNVTAHCGDSIRAINEADPRLGRYGLVVVDNNIGGLYGPNCEHFEIMPAIFRTIDRSRPYGVLVLNFISDPDLMKEDERFASERLDEQIERRRAFYETDARHVTPAVAVERYRRDAEREGFSIEGYTLVPRFAFLHFLVLFLKPKAS